jgi:hypothetical protein
VRCPTCGVRVSLPSHQRIEIDTLIKEYVCKNFHKTIYKRYGHTVEINGKKTQVNELFNLEKAMKSQENKKRDILKINDLRTTKNR